MSATKIPYCDATLNPWVGCTKIRAGCVNCYAERLAYRLAAMGQANYATVLDGRCWNGKIAYQMDQLEKLKHWRKPRRVFVGSMSDIHHEKVPFCEIVRVFDAMYANPQHTYLITTKRPERALEFARWLDVSDKPTSKWMDNLWLGISCSTQKDLDEMVPVLFRIPAAHYWFSLEPLLESVDLKFHLGLAENHEDLRGLCSWIVVGAESGPNRRPCDIKWVRSIVRQCKEASVAVYVKGIHDANKRLITNPALFPKDLRVRETPK